MHKHIKSIDELNNSDKIQLQTTKTVDGKSVWDTLTKDYNVKNITDDDTKVDNKKGTYQIVKIKTDQSMPKEVNYLTHSSAGILSKHYLEQMNKEKSKEYGAPNTVPKTDEGDNNIVASGAYIITKKNNYQASFQKNPGFNVSEKGLYGPAKIKDIILKFNDDANSAVSEIRNHSIDLLTDIDQKNFDLIKSDSDLSIIQKNGRKSVFLMLNTKRGVFKNNPHLRKAVVNAIDQNQFIKFYRGDKFKIVSPVTPLLKTGNEQKQNLDKVQEEINKRN